MAIPTVPKKSLMAHGMRKTTAWETSLALGAGYGIDLTSNGGLNRTQPYVPDLSADQPLPLEGDLGPIDPVVFAPEFEMRYDPGPIAMALALLFGTAGEPFNRGGGAYQHTFQWADEIYGLFLTYAEERTAKIFEVPSAKPTTFDITVDGGFLKGKLGLIGNTLINNSTINTLTQMDALTYKDRGRRIQFKQATIKMNAQSAGDVTGETPLVVSDFSVHYERPQDREYKAGSDFIVEPVGNGAPIITVELKFPRENTVNMNYFTTNFVGQVEQKLEIIIIGPTLGSSTYWLHLVFPRLRVIGNLSTYEDVLKNGIMLQVEEASSVPAAMTYARPYINLQNNSSTDYLG